VILLPEYCAICDHLGLERRLTTSILGIETRLPDIFSAATGRVAAAAAGPSHVLVPMCPEHVVDVYRERVPGVTMAWRIPARAR
jgi:hypothetical protein